VDHPHDSTVIVSGRTSAGRSTRLGCKFASGTDRFEWCRLSPPRSHPAVGAADWPSAPARGRTLASPHADRLRRACCQGCAEVQDDHDDALPHESTVRRRLLTPRLWLATQAGPASMERRRSRATRRAGPGPALAWSVCLRLLVKVVREDALLMMSLVAGDVVRGGSNAHRQPSSDGDPGHGVLGEGLEHQHRGASDRSQLFEEVLQVPLVRP
jgi:hypothetical protein